MLIVAIISLFLPPWVDHTMKAYPGFNPPAVDTQSVVHGVFWTGIFMLGLLVGFAINSALKSKSARWAWVLPVIWFVALVIAEISGGSDPGEGGTAHIVWRTFTGQDPDQGFLAVLSTWPALTSIGYSLGAWAALKWHSETNAEPSGPPLTR